VLWLRQRYTLQMLLKRRRDGFVAVSATSGGRTATLTTKFDFQYEVSVSYISVLYTV